MTEGEGKGGSGMPVAESHKELRFTRARQGQLAAVLGSVLSMMALVFFLLAPYRGTHPELPHPLWGLVPLGLAVGCFRLAWHCVRHVYLLLSPIGVEVFPFFRPVAGMRVIPWGQIADAEIRDNRLTLHFTEGRTAGVHLALAPISRAKLPLLVAAMEGRFPRSENFASPSCPSC